MGERSRARIACASVVGVVLGMAGAALARRTAAKRTLERAAVEQHRANDLFLLTGTRLACGEASCVETSARFFG